jgi:hypothetical protein
VSVGDTRVLAEKQMHLTLHWRDGRTTEYRAFAYEVSWEERTLKIWGWQVFDEEPYYLPLEYHDRQHGLFYLGELIRLETDRD